jgi:hemoglobin/transferrin/lactoferrin receptor protein
VLIILRSSLIWLYDLKFINNYKVKKFFLTGYLLVFTFSIYAQVLTILDKETGKYLELVTIYSEIPHVYTITNMHGQVDISEFKNAERIEIRLVGYKYLVLSYQQLEETSFLVRLQPAKINLDEVVVSANRWNQKTSEIPAKVISVSPQTISLQNPQTAADMLESSGKVFVQKSQQGGGSPMIRGFATNRLLYSVDGVRMNTAIFRGGNIQNVISLDPFAMEHVEVLFGPGSVIYGSDAIGGVMSFNTLGPQLSLNKKPLITGKSVARYSSANNEKTGHFDINLGWEKWAGVTSISSYDFDDLLMGSLGPEEYLRPFYVQRQDSIDKIVTNDNPRLQKPSGYSQMNMMQKLRFKPNDYLDFQYSFHYSETSDYSRYDRHIRYKNGLPRYGEWYYGPQKWMMNNLSLKFTQSSRMFNQVSFRFAQQYFEESRVSRNINKPDRKIRIEKVDAYSLNVDFVRDVNERNHIFYGFEAVKDYVNSTGIDENISTGDSRSGSSRYPQSDWASYAFYLTDQARLFGPLSLHTGIRYNQYMIHAEFDNTYHPFQFTEANLNNAAATGSFGIVYRPERTWVVRANASTAFRSPNVDDIGKVFDSEPGAVTVPNPGLEAEYAYNAELSISKLYEEIVKLDLTGYYTLLNNAMVRRDYTLNGLDSMMYDGEMSRIQAIQNAAKAHVYGIQASLNIELPAGFGISSDFNYQKGEEELDDGSKSPSRHVPPWFGTSWISYISGKTTMQFYAVYNGEKNYKDLPEEEKSKTEIYAVDENGNPWSPGWYTINFKVLFQETEQIALSAAMENITDQRYRPYSSGIVAPGRNFIISLKVNF